MKNCIIFIILNLKNALKNANYEEKNEIYDKKVKITLSNKDLLQKMLKIAIFYTMN